MKISPCVGGRVLVLPLLLYAALSWAAAGEMDCGISGDWITRFHAAYVPELDGTSHSKGTVDGGRIAATHGAARSAGLKLVGVDADSTMPPVPESCRARFNSSLLSASVVVEATRPAAAAAAAATALQDLNSDDLHYDWTIQIQPSIADDRLIALMIVIIMTIDRANQGKRSTRSGRRRCSSAAMLTIMLLAAAAALFANSATAARPSHDGVAGGHNEAAAAAAADAVPGVAQAAAGHSACTTDPNEQVPIRCIHH